MQWEVIKWLQSLDLSHPVRNPRRDFANGFIAAEIVCRYFDDRYLSMRGISQSTSADARRRNWEQVHTALMKVGCRTITHAIVENTIHMNPNAALNVLEHMYEFFTKKLLPMRTIDAITPAQFIKSEDAPALTALLQSVGERQADGIPLKRNPTGDTEEELIQNHFVVSSVQNALAVGRNAEVVGGLRPLLQPRYSHHTASSLIHQANHSRYKTRLHQAKNELDILESQMQNEHIMKQHQKVKELLNAVENQKDNSRKEEYTDGTSLTSRLRGRHYISLKSHTARKSNSTGRERKSDGTFNDSAFQEPINSVFGACSAGRIEVNVLSSTLMSALENNGIYLNRDARAGEKSIEFFTSCEFNVRKAFSSILKDVLAARKELIYIVERSAKCSEADVLEDLFTAFVAQRNHIPTDTLEACWTALAQNTSGIAVAIGSKMDEYGYILQTLHYIFTLEASQMHVLHVSGPQGTDSSSSSPTSASTTSSCFFPPPFASERNRSQSISRALLGGWGLEGTAAIMTARRDSSGSEEPSGTVRRPHATWLDRKAFHYASAFVLLAEVAEALHSWNAEIAERVLETYFLPAALPFLILYGRPGMVEAVGRVMVAFLMGSSSTSTQQGKEKERESGEEDEDTWNDEKRAETQHQLENMVKFLECVLQPMVLNEEQLVTVATTGGVSAVRTGFPSFPSSDRSIRCQHRSYLQQRYYFLVYSVMRQTTAAYSWGGSILRALAAEDALSHPFFASREEEHNGKHPLELFASDIAVRCLTSEHSITRATGIAVTTMLLFWDSWIPFISIVRQFILCCPPLAEGGSYSSSSSLDRRSSSELLFSSLSHEFEGRVLTLGLICLLFKKIVLFVCDDCGSMADEGTNCSTEDIADDDVGLEGHASDGHRPLSKLDDSDTLSVPSSEEAAIKRTATREKREYRAACQKILSSLPFRELDHAAAKYLSTFAYGPLKQRQLALAVVGQHLLPDGHPYLASVWLRLVFSLPSPHADFVIILPSSPQKLEMRRPSALHYNEYTASSGAAEQCIRGREGMSSYSSPSSTAMPFILHEKVPAPSISPLEACVRGKNSVFSAEVSSSEWMCSSALSDSPDASPIGLLFGQVAPAYSLVPLNQVWDTYSVIHVVLRYLPYLDPIKTLEIIAAALLSPQEQDSQLSQLLRNYHFSVEKEVIVRGIDVSSLQKDSRESYQSTSCRKNVSKFNAHAQHSHDDDSESVNALTLRELVMSSTARGENPFAQNSLPVPHSVGEAFSQQCLSSPSFAEENDNKVTILKEKEGFNVSGKADTSEVGSSSFTGDEHRLSRAFWYTALQRLEPVITSQLPSLDEGEKTFDELSHGEQLSFAVLKTLYYRFVMGVPNWVEESKCILVESIWEAASWLQGQKATW